MVARASSSLPASSPFGAGETTGPKYAVPSPKEITGVPTSSPTREMAFSWEARSAVSVSSPATGAWASMRDSGRPASAAARRAVARRSWFSPPTWYRSPHAVYQRENASLPSARSMAIASRAGPHESSSIVRWSASTSEPSLSTDRDITEYFGAISRTSAACSSQRLVIQAKGQTGSTKSSTVRADKATPRLGGDAAILSPAGPARAAVCEVTGPTAPHHKKHCTALEGRVGSSGARFPLLRRHGARRAPRLRARGDGLDRARAPSAARRGPPAGDPLRGRRAADPDRAGAGDRSRRARGRSAPDAAGRRGADPDAGAGRAAVGLDLRPDAEGVHVRTAPPARGADRGRPRSALAPRAAPRRRGALDRHLRCGQGL